MNTAQKVESITKQLDKLMDTSTEPLQEFTGVWDYSSFVVGEPLVMVTEMASVKMNLMIDFKYVEIMADNERYLQINIHELNPAKWSIFTEKIYLKQGLSITSLQRPVLQYLSDILLVYTTL